MCACVGWTVWISDSEHEHVCKNWDLYMLHSLCSKIFPDWPACSQWVAVHLQSNVTNYTNSSPSHVSRQEKERTNIWVLVPWVTSSWESVASPNAVSFLALWAHITWQTKLRPTRPDQVQSFLTRCRRERSTRVSRFWTHFLSSISPRACCT